MKRFFSSIVLSVILISVCSAQSFNAQNLRIKTVQERERAVPTQMSRSESSVAESFFEMLFDLFLDLWFIDSMIVTFDDYPYHSGKYIQFDSSNPFINGSSVTSDYQYDVPERKNQFYRFGIDTSMFFFPSLMVGNQTRVEGLLWKFFGPIFQIDTTVPTSVFTDGNSLTSLDTNLQLGLQMSIFQTNPLSLYWTICWQRIQHQGIPVLNGVAFQLIARSYPISPLLIEWRGTIGILNDESQTYSTEFNWESHLEIGMMLNGPVEVFAAWRYFSYLDISPACHGIEVGARYHF